MAFSVVVDLCLDLRYDILGIEHMRSSSRAYYLLIYRCRDEHKIPFKSSPVLAGEVVDNRRYGEDF